MSMQTIRPIFADLYLGKIDSDEAKRRLAASLTLSELADVYVESFNRGWISRVNLGIDDDGNLI